MSERRSADLLAPGERAWVLEGYRSLLRVDPDVEPRLRGALVSTLERVGGLTRAQVAYDVARTLGAPRDEAREVAVAIEYLHTASLLFDDLPAMDDAGLRRGEPCPHLVYGEGPTILAALALINRAYHLVWRAISRADPEVWEPASDLVASCLGPEGLLGGQALDLAFAGSQRSGEGVLAAAGGKTVAMVRLTLVLPALLYGVSTGALSVLEALAGSWGHAYQIVDDFHDALPDAADSGKTGGRDAELARPNLPGTVGADAALARARAELTRADVQLARLSAWMTPPAALQAIFLLLRGQVERLATRIGRRPAA